MKHLIKIISRWKWQLISIALGVSFIFTFFQYTRAKTQITATNTQTVMNQLSKMMLLPDEKPQIVPIMDVASYQYNLPDFYKDAESGNLLIQYKNGLILYDAKKNKIINIAVNGILNKPKPTDVLKIAFRFNGNEQYRALWLRRQVEEDMGNSAYQVIELAPSKAAYKEDVIYLVNNQKKDLATQFAKAIGDSPVIEKLEPDEAPTDADIIVVFHDSQRFP